MKYLLFLLSIFLGNNEFSNAQSCDLVISEGEYCNSEDTEQKWKLVLLPGTSGFEFYCVQEPNWRFTLGYYDRDGSDETVTLCSDNACNTSILFFNCALNESCIEEEGYRLIEFSLKEDGDEILHGRVCCPQ